VAPGVAAVLGFVVDQGRLRNWNLALVVRRMDLLTLSIQEVDRLSNLVEVDQTTLAEAPCPAYEEEGPSVS
jgi:hypothetical protein